MKYIQTTVQFEISCQHRLENPLWTKEKNQDYYGVCYQRHGHNYGVQIVFESEVNPQTGLAFDRQEVSQLCKQEIESGFHAKFLNEVVDNTSGESLCLIFMDRIKTKLPKNLKLKAVQIQETRKNWFASHV